MPPGAATRFIIDDGEVTNVVAYTFIQGDGDADADVDMDDFTLFQDCFSQSPVSSPCQTFDFNTDDTIDLTDYTIFAGTLTGVLTP